MAWDKPYPETPAAPADLARFAQPQVVGAGQRAPLVGAVVFDDARGREGGKANTIPAGAVEEGPRKNCRRILLLQRAAHDSAPGCWEAPGGSFESTDANILRAVGRELWEETGLRLRRVIRLVAEVDIQDDHWPGVVWPTATFQVEVEDEKTTTRSQPDGTGGKDIAESPFAVRIDPEEHQDWGWATEAEVRSQTWDKGPMELFKMQKQVILQAFAYADYQQRS